MNRERIVWASLLLWGAAACEESSDPVNHSTLDAAVEAGTLEPDDASSRAPFPAPEWQMSTPAAQGMKQEGIDVALDYAFQAAKNTQGVLVIRHRSIVAERYEAGRDASSFAASWSMGKSITSALVGIAIDRGLIKNVDVKMTDYYPDWVGTAKADMRLRDVLQMASGLAWVEEYRPGADVASDIVTMVFEADALKFASTRPFKNAPGSVFNYSSGDTMLVSGVLEKATGMSALEFGKKELFTKIGMSPVEWWRDTSGHTLTYCCVDTPTRQFAKFGLLFLERGKWNGERIISEAWIDESLRPSSSFEGYGFFWWLIGRTNAAIPADTYAARGVDGQLIYVIPSRDLIVVRNGHYDKRLGDALADPNLFTVYPSFGLVPDAGTRPPDSWKDEEFLAPIVGAVMD
jgi:CubicO group peptidase (beta-lactamase class C family)